jgi:2-oxoglutarate ferredoxin oxidoreductase subunit alpha
MMSRSISIAFTGSGGAGAMTAGQALLDAAARAGYYGFMTRSLGPQIRGGEAAALLRIGCEPVGSAADVYDILVAFDWMSVSRFAGEIPLAPASLVLADPEAGPMPAQLALYGAPQAALAFGAITEAIDGGRANMVGLGAVAALIGLDIDVVEAALAAKLGKKGEATLAASRAAILAGAQAVAGLPRRTLDKPAARTDGRWNISGNEAAGLGALRAGVRFVAAYPITPATEILEWMAPALAETGGVLVQAEDELASINMTLGASFSGVPAMTATSGPGLALMTEALGLAVASETPVVVVDVMRGGPSTGIPTKSEQADLNIALSGLHGDAPHLVVAPNSVADCLAATQWAVHLAEALQAPAIVLSDQAMGQARAIVDAPADELGTAKRLVAETATDGYARYALTETGVSPMALPGTPGGAYIADGLEHNVKGTPSSQAGDHRRQLDKRAKKLDGFDYGTRWADIEGDGEVAVVTWGSTTGAVLEAVEGLRAEGRKVKTISLRLLQPARPAEMAAALAGVDRVVVVEQSHSRQFHQYLRAHFDLPARVDVISQPGPLPIRPHDIAAAVIDRI